MRSDWSHAHLMIVALAVMPCFGVAARAEREGVDRGSERGVKAEPRVIEIEDFLAIDIEGVVDAGVGDVAGQATACETIGGWQLVPPLAGANRFRGNAYTIDGNVNLIEYSIELAIPDGAVADLEFVVYEFDVEGSQWVKIHTLPESVQGDGQRHFYSTDRLVADIELIADTLYAIGAAWGDTTIIYNTDTESYPRLFAVGSIDGRVALNNPPSPMPNPLNSLSINPNGVYSVQLCFTGACCLPTNTCADLTENECLLQNGQFSASGVGCLDISGCPMTRGACCLESGSCSFINEYKCKSIDANATWTSGTPCNDPSEPCAPRGGCCFADDVTPCIDDLTVTDCELVRGGTYRGDDVTCDTFPPCTAGACCDRITAECTLEVTETGCGLSGGDFAGLGSRCIDDPCSTKGACCVDSTCSEVTEQECVDVGGSYRGDLSTCGDLAVACGRGPCCRTRIGCQLLAETDCISLGGTFRGEGLTCDEISPRCPGVCCEANGLVCTPDVTPELCSGGLGGVFAGYAAVCPDPDAEPPDPDPCDYDQGNDVRACCLGGSGTCIDYIAAGGDQSDCVNGLGGTPNDTNACAGVDCPVEPVLGACCDRASLECTDNLEEADCTGQWTEGALCDDLFPACEPFGACCNRPQLSCEDSTKESKCLFDWTEGTACDELLDPCAPDGACCNLNTGACRDVPATVCVETNEAYSGDGTSCADAGVCQVGACCTGEQCILTTGAFCGSANNYAGDGTECTPELCKLGACCDTQSTSCADLNQLTCDRVGWTYRGAGSSCDNGQCPPPTGACCVDDPGPGYSCNEVSEDECTVAAGVYRGDDTDCLAQDVCALGACCDLATGLCEDDTAPVDCATEWTEDTTCATLDPPCEAVGACCNLDRTCQELTLAACDAVSGVYQGDGTDCGQACPVLGACCQRDGTCADRVEATSCAADPGAPPADFSPGQLCENVCGPRGACCTGEVCQVTADLECTDLQGIYSGDGTDCVKDLCVAGACCLPDEDCEILTRQACESNANLGVYAGAGTECLPVDQNQCRRGACCPPEGAAGCFDNVIAQVCTEPEDFQIGELCVACEGRGACCLPNETCEVLTAAVCLGRGGQYSGDTTTCDPAGLCVSGACCFPDGSCLDETLQTCDVIGGFYQGIGTSCADAVPCPPFGACCDRATYACTDGVPEVDCPTEWTEGTTCDELLTPCEPTGACCNRATYDCTDGVFEADCGPNEWTAETTCDSLDPPCAPTGACCDPTAGTCDDGVLEIDCAAEWTQDTACDALDPPCEVTGACCLPDETCALETALDCGTLGGTYSGDDTECIADLCSVGACCLLDDSCQDLTLQACNDIADARYLGAGTACVAGQCPQGCEEGIQASDPLNCSIDARYPTAPDNANELFGWDAVDLTVNCDASLLAPGDFAVSVEPADVTPPDIVSVSGLGLSATVTFDGPIPAAHWTCVRHVASGTETCLGFLPADADGGRAANATDVLSIIDGLNGIITLEIYQCDTDRSGACTATDVLGVIDLLNAAGAFDSWNNVTLPLCPSAP